MNDRMRQKIRAIMHRQKPDLFATLKCDESSHFLSIVFVPQDQVAEYKEKYGDKLNIWFEDELEGDLKCSKT